jgi:hypothetical protein
MQSSMVMSLSSNIIEMKSRSASKIITICLLLLYSVCSYAQKPQQFNNIKTFAGPITDFTVDILGNIYIVNPQNNLKKINENGDSVAVYNNVRLFGKLTDVNATNPLKLLLYYQPFSTIVTLDRFLHRRNTIDLRKQNIFTVRAISPSYDNNIWVFDEQESKLKKISDEGAVLNESNDFRMMFDTVPSPVKIIDRDGFVYLYDPAKGLYIFDYYGALKLRLPFVNWKDFEVVGKNIYGFDEKNYYVYANNTLDIKTYSLPTAMKAFDILRLGNDKVYILKDGELKVFQLQ